MVVQTSCNQVVGNADGVHIAGEVQIDVLHRYDLCVAATSRAALNAEYRTERWFAQRRENILTQLVQRIRQSDSCRRLALARRGRRDRSHQHQLAVRHVSLVL